jgi:murein L,D-transpeptidase YcbB/YkuD
MSENSRITDFKMKNASHHLFSSVILLTGMLMAWSCGLKRPTAATTTIEYLQSRPAETKLREEDFGNVFRQILGEGQTGFSYPELINRFYERNQYKPVLVQRFLAKHQLQVLQDYLMKTADHGLDTLFFLTGTLREQMAKVDERRSKKAIVIYRDLIELELSVVENLIRYSTALQYGVTAPAEIYKQYSTATAEPDSNFVMGIFEIRDLKKYLDSIQPTGRTYLALQKKLIETRQDSSETGEETRKVLIINMERLRWKNRPVSQKYVSVNIAGYYVDVMENEKSLLHMKVCVGEKGDHETPQLGSMIHSVQVNPVWNIPRNIALNEIIKFATDDRYYLTNNNINVYRKGKLVRDPEIIDWSKADVSIYSFQQQPGVENALGRIKFLFENNSSVYLHDTPVKSVFNKKNRAISHGCVRVEKPLELAYALFGKGEQYQQIKKAMDSGYPRAKFIALPKQIPIRLEYYTAWADSAGAVQYSDDVYDLDDVVYKAIQKMNEVPKKQRKLARTRWE